MSRCSSGDARACQLLVSAVSPVVRSDLWHLVMRFHDRPGLLADLATLLRTRDIDIFACKAATRHHVSAVVVEADIDARLYKSKYDLDSATRQRNPAKFLLELHALLLARFIEDIEFAVDGTPCITLTRHQQLRRSAIEAEEQQECRIENGFISLDQGLLGAIQDEAVANWPHLASSGRSPLVLLVAEPLVFSLTMTIFYPTTGHIHVRVTIDNSKGLLAALTSEIRERGLNVVHMYARTVSAGEKCVIDFFLHMPGDIEHDDRRLRTFVRGVLTNKSLKIWDPVVLFPEVNSGPRPREYERRKHDRAA
jgi:hypothetical protein